ncbi:MAG: LptE family protein [bacterium]
MQLFAREICAIALVTAMAGCASYHTARSIPHDLRTVAVPTFENASGQPQAEALTTLAVLSEFRRDGALKIVERENAALEVAGRVTGCKLEPMRFDHDRPYLAVEYRLTLTADVKVYERATGKVVASLKKVTGTDIFRTQSDLPSSQRDALPRAAAKLAKTIVNETLMAW